MYTIYLCHLYPSDYYTTVYDQIQPREVPTLEVSCLCTGGRRSYTIKPKPSGYAQSASPGGNLNLPTTFKSNQGKCRPWRSAAFARGIVDDAERHLPAFQGCVIKSMEFNHSNNHLDSKNKVTNRTLSIPWIVRFMLTGPGTS